MPSNSSGTHDSLHTAAGENLPAPIKVAADDNRCDDGVDALGKCGNLLKERVGGVKQLDSKDGVTKGLLGLVSSNKKLPTRDGVTQVWLALASPNTK